MIKNIDGYRNLIEKYNGFGYQSDDYLLYLDAEKFYNTPSETKLEGIIQYLKTKAISSGLKGLAQQLEALSVPLPPPTLASPILTPVPPPIPKWVPPVPPVPPPPPPRVSPVPPPTVVLNQIDPSAQVKAEEAVVMEVPLPLEIPDFGIIQPDFGF